MTCILIRGQTTVTERSLQIRCSSQNDPFLKRPLSHLWTSVTSVLSCISISWAHFEHVFICAKRIRHMPITVAFQAPESVYCTRWNETLQRSSWRMHAAQKWMFLGRRSSNFWLKAWAQTRVWNFWPSVHFRIKHGVWIFWTIPSACLQAQVLKRNVRIDMIYVHEVTIRTICPCDTLESLSVSSGHARWSRCVLMIALCKTDGTVFVQTLHTSKDQKKIPWSTGAMGLERGAAVRGTEEHGSVCVSFHHQAN